jgi:hypothetical protein
MEQTHHVKELVDFLHSNNLKQDQLQIDEEI